jgi:60 kDa SS-A/Ro ribonucleoprotein
MANRALFKNKTPGRMVPETTTKNEAGGKAYAFSDEHALAQYAATGCINGTYYASAQDQLDTVLGMAKKCSSEFIAKTALWVRTQGFMKDMPALLCCVLAARKDEESRALLTAVFPRVIDNGKMLMNFVQIMRSGAVGRKSMGSLPRRLVRNWLNEHDGNWLFRNSVGQKPSMGDIVKMVHPKAKDAEHDALFGYFIKKDLDGKAEALPPLVKEFEAWKLDRDLPLPKVPFQLLTNEQLSDEQWATIIENGNWHFTRMNLNTAARHNVFTIRPELVEVVAKRLADPAIIQKVKVFPYQILMTYKAASESAPRPVINALHDALEESVKNIPAIEGDVVVFPDVSASMSSPVTGGGGWSTPSTKVSCIDVAALFSAAILRMNPNATIVPIDTKVHPTFKMEPRDSVMTNAKNLGAFRGGGTSLGSAIQWMNGKKMDADVIIFVSDNQSWADPWGDGRGTLMLSEFRKVQKRRPNAKLICIDVQPYGNTQAGDEKHAVLNVGGWSDRVFTVIDSFLKGDPKGWVDTIKAVEV